MNIFGIGPLELLVVAIVAVVVLGPERFPQVAVQLARAIKWLRGYATDNTRELREEFAELTKEYESIREELSQVQRQVRSPIAQAAGELTKIAETTKKEVESVSPERIMPASEPIVEPGGELPEDYQHSDNGA